jgi:hypothetical protein
LRGFARRGKEEWATHAENDSSCRMLQGGISRGERGWASRSCAPELARLRQGLWARSSPCHGWRARPGAVKDSPSRLGLDDLLLCLAMHARDSIGCGHKFRVVRLPVEARDCSGRRGEALAQLRSGRTRLCGTLLPQPCPLEAVHSSRIKKQKSRPRERRRSTLLGRFMIDSTQAEGIHRLDRDKPSGSAVVVVWGETRKNLVLQRVRGRAFLPWRHL